MSVRWCLQSGRMGAALEAVGVVHVIKCLGTFQNALGTFTYVLNHVTGGVRPGVVLTSPDVSLGASGRTAE